MTFYNDFSMILLYIMLVVVKPSDNKRSVTFFMKYRPRGYEERKYSSNKQGTM